MVEERNVEEEEQKRDECREEDDEEHETNSGHEWERKDAVVFRPRGEEAEHPN